MNQILQGIPASEGMAIGNAYILGSIEQLVPMQALAESEIRHELERFRQAIETSRKQIEALLTSSNLDDDLKSLFEIQLLLLKDPMLIDQSIDRIQGKRVNAEAALASELEILKNSVFNNRDRQVRDHFSDLEDITNRLLSNLMGIKDGDIRIQELNSLPADAILLAETISPSLMLHINNIAGIGIASSQVSEHMVLLARSRNIPVLVGIDNVIGLVKKNESVLIDAVSGILIIKPDDKYRQTCQQWLVRQKHNIESKIQSPVMTIDGSSIELWCNLGDAGSSQDVRIRTSSGVGLFRTEFLYMKDSALFHNIHRQIELYSDILTELGDRPVTFRLLDTSPDKPLLSASGVRDQHLAGVRFLLANPKLLQSQIRSILEAAWHTRSRGARVQLMVPMVSRTEEFMQVREIFLDIRAEIASDNDIPFQDLPPVQLGVMLETPAAILMLRELSEHADFFSIGSNDLAQLVLGMPRQSQSLTDDHTSFQPALYRMIHQVTLHAKKEVSICGEIAARLDIIPLLIGLGLSKLSVTPANLLYCHDLIRQLSLPECRLLADEALQCRYASDLHTILNAFHRRLQIHTA